MTSLPGLCAIILTNFFVTAGKGKVLVCPHRNPVHVNLALQCIANIGSKEMADSFGNEIPKLLVSG